MLAPQRAAAPCILIALGIFLRSQARPQTYFTFEDVLTQIGLGYVFLFLLAWTAPRAQCGRGAAILVGYWAAFALYPLPPPGFDTHDRRRAAPTGRTTSAASRRTGTRTRTSPPAPTSGSSTSFRASGRSSTTAAAISTLNFVPSLATMIFGLLAGGVLRSARAGPEKLQRARHLERRRARTRRRCFTSSASAPSSSASGRPRGRCSAPAG